MKTKPRLIYDTKWTFSTKTGKTVIVIMKLRHLFDGQFGQEYPEGYKINWIAYNEDNPKERVLFDNHHGKVLHYHIDQDKKGIIFTWVSREKTEELFWEKVQKRFGNLIKIW